MGRWTTNAWTEIGLQPASCKPGVYFSCAQSPTPISFREENGSLHFPNFCLRHDFHAVSDRLLGLLQLRQLQRLTTPPKTTAYNAYGKNIARNLLTNLTKHNILLTPNLVSESPSPCLFYIRMVLISAHLSAYEPWKQQQLCLALLGAPVG